jgi:hypothetical protein
VGGGEESKNVDDANMGRSLYSLKSRHNTNKESTICENKNKISTKDTREHQNLMGHRTGSVNSVI